jgi:hypothetical protein
MTRVKNNATYIIMCMNLKYRSETQVWWYTLIIPALRRQRQEDHKFEASIGYTVRPF